MMEWFLALLFGALFASCGIAGEAAQKGGTWRESFSLTYAAFMIGMMLVCMALIPDQEGPRLRDPLMLLVGALAMLLSVTKKLPNVVAQWLRARKAPLADAKQESLK